MFEILTNDVVKFEQLGPVLVLLLIRTTLPSNLFLMSGRKIYLPFMANHQPRLDYLKNYWCSF